MSKKQDSFYFNNFTACAEYSCQAAHLLKSILEQYDPDRTVERMDEIHRIEHAADEAKHEMTDRLSKAFITPLEREDISALSSTIDDMTDKIEDVLIRIYINNVRKIRMEAIQLLDTVILCYEEVCALMKDFSDFRHSKTIKDRIIRINSLEEEADNLYISGMRTLHTEETNPLLVIAWREIYTYLEKCADTAEHVADGVERVIMKNS